MKQLISNVRSLFNVPELHEHIAKLEAQLKVANNRGYGPSFYSVATGFDASALEERVFEHMVNKLSPMLNDYAVDSLVKVMTRYEPHRNHAMLHVAGDYNSHMLEVRVNFPEFTQSIQIMM